MKLIGVGESLEDLRPFDAEDFARALIARGANRDRRWTLWIIWLWPRPSSGSARCTRAASTWLPFALGAALAAVVSLLGVGRAARGVVFVVASR